MASQSDEKSNVFGKQIPHFVQDDRIKISEVAKGAIGRFCNKKPSLFQRIFGGINFAMLTFVRTARFSLGLLGKAYCGIAKRWKDGVETILSKFNIVPTPSFLCTCGATAVCFALVIPAGFEPTTHSLEGCCSIQLSYETCLLQSLLRCKNRTFTSILQIVAALHRLKSTVTMCEQIVFRQSVEIQ